MHLSEICDINSVWAVHEFARTYTDVRMSVRSKSYILVTSLKATDVCRHAYLRRKAMNSQLTQRHTCTRWSEVRGKVKSKVK